MASETRHRKLSIITAIFILFVGIFLGGYLVLKSGRGSAGKLDDILNGRSIIAGVCQPDASNAQKDSDDDSLKDWEELQIHKTDPCKPDSDGDGYLDGEEIASGYDPTKKAPGDELPGTDPKTPRPLPQNLTEALRQQLLGQIQSNQIRAFNEKGELLSQDEIASYPAISQSVQQIISNQAQLFSPEAINENEIKISQDNGKASIQNYASAAEAAFSTPAGIQSPSESEMFIKAIQTNDFSELDLLLNSYRSSYAKLKNLSVPSELLSIHKEQLNIISSLIKIYESVRQINTDPLRANLALQTYEVLSEEMGNWMSRVAEYIANKS